MAAVNADLAHNLQRESIYSAAYMASAGTQWKSELAKQRTATNAAIGTYKTTLDRSTRSPSRPTWPRTSAAVNDAISNLPTQRNSVDGLETPAPTAISQFDAASQDLAKFNSGLAQAANDPTLSRGLTTFANLNGFKAATANQAALAVSLVQVGQLPEDLAGRRPGGRALRRGQHVGLRGLRRPERGQGRLRQRLQRVRRLGHRRPEGPGAQRRGHAGQQHDGRHRDADLQHRAVRLPAGPGQEPAERLEQRAHQGQRPEPGPVVAQGRHRPERQLHADQQDGGRQRGHRPARLGQELRGHRHR